MKELFVLTQYRIQINQRDRLFFDRFEYSFRFKQREVYAIRGLPDTPKLMKFIEHRRAWMRSVTYQRNQADEHFTLESIEGLIATKDLLSNHSTEFKMTVSGDWAIIYTNDLNLVDRISRLPQVWCDRTVVKAEVCRLRDTVVIREPKYRYRTYFRERKMRPEVKTQLLDWIGSQHYQDVDNVRASGALKSWLKNEYSSWRKDWCMRHYYIEHNDTRYETMIGMVAPGFVRKTVRVITPEENLLEQSADK